MKEIAVEAAAPCKYFQELLPSESETARARRPWQASSRQCHDPKLRLPISCLPRVGSLPSAVNDSNLGVEMALPVCWVLTTPFRSQAQRRIAIANSPLRYARSYRNWAERQSSIKTPLRSGLTGGSGDGCSAHRCPEYHSGQQM